jgi:hypothetical protein
LCKKHFLVVLDGFDMLKVGRPRKIEFERVLEWLEDRKGYVMPADFMKEFLISHPTTARYFAILEKYGFVKKEGRKWRILN